MLSPCYGITLPLKGSSPLPGPSYKNMREMNGACKLWQKICGLSVGWEWVVLAARKRLVAEEISVGDNPPDMRGARSRRSCYRSSPCEFEIAGLCGEPQALGEEPKASRAETSARPE
ncbi:hypothetical protein PIB30_068335 [Stylosanthes scabra]|uniref:Uncharacterized protein n=1 Tax=Stylosanthes scabra TaxID=79078 RepID=A0ABU6YNM5_9FABA|nr:hypothetical protein [Stylosanthes scabra]